MTIGDRIRIKREELGWTQEMLAIKMGYKTRNAIYQYEKAENMKLSLIQKFADVLGCEVSYLTGWDEEEKEVPTYNPAIQEFVEILPKLTNEQIDSLLHTAQLFLAMNSGQ